MYLSKQILIISLYFQAAAMSGLIARIIFISPSWDTSEEVTYYATKVDIGTTRVNNVKEPVFCSCEIMPPTQPRECVYEKSAVYQRDHGTGNGGGDGDHGDKGGNKGGDKGGDKGADKGGDQSNSDEVVIDNPDDCKVRTFTVFCLNVTTTTARGEPHSAVYVGPVYWSKSWVTPELDTHGPRSQITRIDDVCVEVRTSESQST